MRIGIYSLMQSCTPGIGATADAVYVWLCNTYHNRTITDFSYNKIAKVCGIAWATAKKAVHRLISLGYAQISGTRLFLKSRKSKHSNFRLDQLSCYRYNRSTGQHEGKGKIKRLKYILLGLHIAKIQSQKNYVKGLLAIIHPPVNRRVTLAQVKAARKELARLGIDANKRFWDNGISYDAIKKAIKCSNYLVRTITKKTCGLLYRISRRSWQFPRKYRELWDHLGKDLSKSELFSILHSLTPEPYNLSGGFFATKNNLYWVKPNLYTLKQGWVDQ